MKYLLIVPLIFTIFLQAGVIGIPLALGFLVMMWILYQESWVIVTAFLAGILIDIVSFHMLGASSIFFLATFFLIQLYQRKFEIQSLPFVGTSVFVVSLFYGAIYIQKSSFFGAFLTALLTTCIYTVVMLRNKSKSSTSVRG